MDSLISNDVPNLAQTEWSSFRESGTTERRLRRDPNVRSSIETDCYLDVLPTFQSKDLVQIINEFKEKGKKPVRLLDIGGGAGLADIDLLAENPAGDLEIVVIGHSNDIKTSLFKPARGVIRNSTEKELKEKGIKFIDIDFSRQSSEEENQLGDFDIIIASHSLKWIAEKRAKENPKYYEADVMDKSNITMVQKVYGLLKADGIALIAPYDQTLNYEINTLEKNNGGISFKKSR